MMDTRVDHGFSLDAQEKCSRFVLDEVFIEIQSACGVVVGGGTETGGIGNAHHLLIKIPGAGIAGVESFSNFHGGSIVVKKNLIQSYCKC